MKVREKILIVDDNRTNIEILEEYLQDDYELEIALSGEEALEKALRFQPAVILLDIMMPGMDGYMVCRRIRSTPSLCHAKIIMVTVKAMLSERLEGYAAGADDYITKPFEEEELLAKVRVYMRLKSVEEMDEINSNLLSLLSHETRTPLTSILLPVEMLMADEGIDDEKRKMLLGIVYHSTKSLQNLFDKILLLSAMKAGTSRFRLMEADLCAVVRDVLGEFAKPAAERQVRIEQRFQTPTMAKLDPDKIKHVVKAIVDNAIRFSPPGGTVIVTITQDGPHCLFSVQDHGEGIEASFLPHIFHEFTCADVDYHASGHGLSLAIAYQIVHRHNGSIDVESRKGQGATFTVRLPALEA